MAEDIKHELLNDESTALESNPDHHEKIKNHLNSEDFDRESYKNLVSGKYKNSGDLRQHLLSDPKEREEDLRGLPDDDDSKKELENGTAFGSLLNHKHNIPENNDELLSNADTDDEYVLRGLKFSKDAIKKRMEEKTDGHGYKDDHAIQALLKNKHLSDPDFNDIVKDLTPEQLDSSDILSNPKIQQEHANKLINSSHMPSPHASHIMADRGMLNPQSAEKYLNNPNNEGMVSTLRRGEGSDSRLDSLLNYLPQEKRKAYLDKHLGITGGEHLEGAPDPEDYDDKENDTAYHTDKNQFDENNFQNWKAGPDSMKGSKRIALLNSKHLDKDQQEHIMRHGGVKSRWDLLNSKHVDPEIAGQMWQKWKDDDDHHGYGQDHFKTHILKDDDYDSGRYDDARQQAEEETRDRYPISEYIDDNNMIPTQRQIERNGPKNGDRYSKNYAYDAHEIADHIKQNPREYDTTSEHPDDPNKKIDFFDQNSGEGHGYQPWEHPDWDEMADKATHKMLTEGDTPDHVHDGYGEAISENANDRTHEILQEHKEDFFKDDSNIPHHLKNIPAIVNRARAKTLKNTKNNMRDFGINEDHPLVHEYGKGQHWHEMVKDHADANDGKVDIGSMNKKYPGLTHKWKEIFGDRNSMTSDEAQAGIDAIPKNKYNISLHGWNHNDPQNLNGRRQLVVRLDNSDDTYKKINEDEDLAPIHKIIQDSSQNSGHPTNHDTIGWSRVDINDPDHWMVDEQQSDIDKSLRNQVENVEDAAPERKAHVLKQVDKLTNEHKGWREALGNYVIKMAKAHGATKLSTHSPESKARHTGADKVHSTYKEAYQQVPRSMGFRSSPGESLPLTEVGKSRVEMPSTDGGATKPPLHKGHTLDLTTDSMKLKKSDITDDEIIEFVSRIVNRR